MGHDVKRDWRFTDQDQYLMDVRLKFCQFSKEVRDHDHCEFCGAKFSEEPGDLHAGYCTADEYYWICRICYEDFKDLFGWEGASPCAVKQTSRFSHFPRNKNV